MLYSATDIENMRAWVEGIMLCEGTLSPFHRTAPERAAQIEARLDQHMHAGIAPAALFAQLQHARQSSHALHVS